MSEALVDSLNSTFVISDKIMFRKDHFGMTRGELRFGNEVAEICLYGASILSYRRANSGEVLFVSERSIFRKGTAIRGGIPVCWPWFGPNPIDSSLPAHGFLRLVDWKIASSSSDENGTSITLSCASNPETRALWDKDFRAEYRVMLNGRLEVELTVMNTGIERWIATGAFHPYFLVDDAARVLVPELDGTRFVDRIDGDAIKIQQGPLTVNDEMNRIYDTARPVTLVDPPGKRQIRIASTGCSSIVAWNPGEKKSQGMMDFKPAEFSKMFCIEPAWIGEGASTVMPGEISVTRMSIGVEDIVG